ncbi:hypothetical protein [Bartonella sp. DGB1]|uniref:hypothetical protein n=1 Tax=Bartonella sp. DGB1 TaxID=3239807 RepID=UPI0035238DF7
MEENDSQLVEYTNEDIESNQENNIDEQDKKIKEVESKDLQKLTSEFWEEAVNVSREALPDIEEAVKFLQKFQDNQLKDMAFINESLQDQKYREKLIQNELEQIIQISALQDKNPVKIIYQLAKLRGYKNLDSQLASNKELAFERAKTLTASNGSKFEVENIDSLVNMPLEDFKKALTRVGGDLKKLL